MKTPLIFSRNFMNFIIYRSDYENIINENKILRQKNTELNFENASLRYLEQENERLELLLGFKKQLPYTSMAAWVIGLDYSGNRKILFLDKGLNDLVKENMACLNSQGLIGKVVEAGKGISKVICLNDPNSRVPARIERTQEQGLVYGTTTDTELEMRYLPKQSRAEIGDVVVSSGLGGIYPKGIMIGRISEIKEADFYNTALILPSVDFLGLGGILLIEKKTAE
jgi:rod shape-determining protein MreC